jgi:hypothetical protein
MVSGYGTLDTAANQICFTPTTDGTYEFIMQVTDSCGVIAQDTIVVTVTFDSIADIDCPTGPIDVALCSPDDICYMLDIEPVDATITLSLGSYTNGEVCFYADTSGVYIDTVIAETSCGSDTCILTFNVDIGSAAEIVCPEPQDFFICQPETICFPITILNRSDTVQVSPIGYYSAGNICFPADTSGHYELTIIASTSCGSDTCVAIIDVTINSAPVADDPSSPVDTFMCALNQICYQFTASDLDGGSLIWSRLSGAGTVTADGLWCFTPTGPGAYTVVAVVTDSCDTADTTTLTYNITVNSPPSLAHDTDLTFFLCQSEQICVNYYVSDPDDNTTLEELIVGNAVIDTAANQICLTPDTSGTYQIIYQVTDACSATDIDTLNIYVAFNEPPVADAGNDRDIFLCSPEEVCWPATCTDPNNNLDTCYLTSGFGTYDGAQICFTPDTAGTYIFILLAVDDCGVADVDTTIANVSLNSPPVCQIPNDTAFFQCSPAQVSLPVSADDPDLNLDHCEIITGPGSIVGDNWVYTPSTDESVTIKIMCIDSCGAVCEDSFTVAFNINAAPVVDLGPDTSYFYCNPGTLCWTVTVDDEDGNLNPDSTEVLSPTGAYLTGNEICYDLPSGDSVYTFIVRAKDSCGAETYDTAIVAIDYNSPPSLNLPPDFIAYLDMVGQLCFDIEPNDPDDNLSGITVSPIGTYMSSTNQICFDADTTGIYCLEVTATDACGATAIDSICIEVVIDQCLHVQIEKTHHTYQGHSELVHIYLQGSGKELGGFELLVAYDATALTVNNVLPGSILEDCGW